jgi:hypothetical protein
MIHICREYHIYGDIFLWQTDLKTRPENVRPPGPGVNQEPVADSRASAELLPLSMLRKV